VFFKTPFYQEFTPGIRRSAPNQSVIDYVGVFTGIPTPTLLYTLPANYPGRNLPDVSANADPDTGYQIYYTSDQSGFGIYIFYGGTSFVAPQMNGVTSLLNQDLKGRVGLMNVPYYLISDLGGSGGTNAPLHPIVYGNNEYYKGAAPYSPGAGLGVINAAALANAMKEIGFGK
jgi:subtilase family serine protease